MESTKIRKSFLDFFAQYKHKPIESSSLVPAGDPSVLLTSAGMQQFKPYFSGVRDPEKDFGSRRTASSQRCFRTTDIESVGDESHLTFFEMLGNFSFNDYFKRDAISLAIEFLEKKMHVSRERLRGTYFAGDGVAPEDTEARELLLTFFEKGMIFPGGKDTNWWGPTGVSGPCGPSAEIHYDMTGAPCEREAACIPNCPCGRFVELWNLVFTEFEQSNTGHITKLKSKNIDTGMGLERLCMVVQKKRNVFDTDLFQPLVDLILRDTHFGSMSSYEDDRRSRIVADHFRGACFLLMDGVGFSNRAQGYILRRIFRRAVDQYADPLISFSPLVEAVGRIYAQVYPQLNGQRQAIVQAMEREFLAYEKILKLDVQTVISKFLKTTALEKDISPQPSKREMTPADAFVLYSTYGISPERLQREGYSFSLSDFEREVEKHRDFSRQGAQAKFGGHGLNDAVQTSYSEDQRWEMTKLHTATHLLHQALRTVLGNHVRQQGSDITPEKLRFDFEHPEKLTEGQRADIEQLVNQKIKEDLPVTWAAMPVDRALSSGALSFFREKYPPEVTVFSIGNFSKEICGGPHVDHTGQIGQFAIVSEKSSGAGIRRIKATVSHGEGWQGSEKTSVNIVPSISP